MLIQSLNRRGLIELFGATAAATAIAACSPLAAPRSSHPVHETASSPTEDPVGASPSPTISPSEAIDDLTIWPRIVEQVGASISPILRPSHLPPEMATARLQEAQRGAFQVEYRGPRQRLLLGVADTILPQVDPVGGRQSLVIRGQPAILQVADAQWPARHLWLSWREPGLWFAAGDAEPRERTDYLVEAEGLELELVRRLVADLAVQWAHDPLTNLTWEEYPIVSSLVDTPDHVEYRDRITAGILARRRAWREPDPLERVAYLNAALTPFGYRIFSKQASLTSPQLYDIIQGGSIVLSNIDAIWPLAVNQAADDFALLVEPVNAPPILVHRRGIEPWPLELHAGLAPVFAGNDLVAVEADSQQLHIRVRRGQEIVFSSVIPGPRVGNPIKGLWSWQGQWVLEADGQVVIDGKSLNQSLGYEEIFSWRILGDQPFFFFNAQSQIGLSSGGKILPIRYENVVHDECCEASVFNIQGNDTVIWFHARRGGVWHYVELGVYPAPAEGTATELPTIGRPSGDGRG